MRLQGKVALVTGAASGIGRGIAVAYVREGARVLATDLNEDGLTETARQAGPNLHPLVSDVTSSAGWKTAVSQAVSMGGGLHILVNNACRYVVKPLTEITEPEWHDTLDSGLTSVYLGMKAAIPVLTQSGGGSIINIASMNQVRYNPAHGAYAAMKAGVVAVTRQVALEYGPRGIRCNAISPGLIETERTRPTSNEDRQLNLECYPVGRIGRVEDVAMAAVFLASEESSFITGVDLLVDGGTTLGAIAGYVKPRLRAWWRSGRVRIEHEPM